ncbi:uncharacterized protein LOC102801026, partial [Saccoglossus kowalevskii]|uniref:Uncharacterized protein LOC102801026 n=1 Tax=Saccoglossus kowalevskii TaxID=10224 RepID=A0ABM0LZF0_SACKO
EAISKRFYYNASVYVPGAVGFWPLNWLYKLEDVSGNNNDANSSNVELVKAYEAKGRPCGAYKFFGVANSWVHYPNNGAFDTVKSITIMAWVCPYGNAGPVFHYNPSGNGVQMWQWASDQAPGELYGRVRFNKRDGTIVAPSDKHIPAMHEWYHCAVTYDFDSNFGSMYLNGEFTALGVMPAGEIATQFDAQSGAVPNAPLPNGGIYFDGLITCVQVYDVALTEEQIRKAAYDERCVCP